jgi:hypothetical protein
MGVYLFREVFAFVKCYGFVSGGVVYYFTVLLRGLSQACYVCSKGASQRVHRLRFGLLLACAFCGYGYPFTRGVGFFKVGKPERDFFTLRGLG